MIRYKLVILFVCLSMLSCGSGNDDAINYNYDNDSLDTSTVSAGNGNKRIVHWPSKFGIGRKATSAEINAWDIDIRPDGKGLPAGSGNAATGKIIYQIKCASCHGKNGEGSGTYSRLMGVMGDTIKAKTIGNYWPYSTTIFDYVRRAMPYNAPGSLKDNEVYSLTAYLLYINKIIDSATTMNARTLPKVQMPAQPYFVNDDRRGGPEVR